MDAVTRYLKDRGVKLGMSREHLYAAVLPEAQIKLMLLLINMARRLVAGRQKCGQADIVMLSRIVERRRPGNAPEPAMAHRASAAPLPDWFRDGRMSLGAPGAASIANNQNHSRSYNSSTETNIGNIAVHTNAMETQGIVNDIGSAINRYSFASHGNYGPN